ncbi:MAG TPA: adenylate/guanylate cyclase domain-containing protein [Chitinophagaceae bacterium]|nr:adenylate/guanylate cyclase domain-containing protein [Chitinophagaceae bacterium]
MKAVNLKWRRIPVAAKYRAKVVLWIALGWTIVDLIYLFVRVSLPGISPDRDLFNYGSWEVVVFRGLIVFIFAGVMGFALFYQAHRNTIELPLAMNFLLKTGLLVVIAFLMNFFLYYLHAILFLHRDPVQSLRNFGYYGFHTTWLIKKLPGWLLTFSLLQVIVEVIKKYSPGIFFDVLLGRYRHPQVEKRIVMFIDLKDSTPIAEKLGHVEYFKFIRQFIELVSMALMRYHGRIYQYVGDEIVVSWIYNARNAKHCLDALIDTRKLIQTNGENFRRQFDVVPDFRVGIHIGEVTVGEIGILKKDLAMSGDTMNTTARIRSACSELNQKFIVSKDVIDTLDLKDWQSESLGLIDLKGKKAGIELFALKI